MQPIREALRNLPEAVFADLLESPEAYLLVLDLPGARQDDVEIDAYEHRLEISARREKSVPEAFEYRSEERSLFLEAVVPVPMDAEPTSAEATMRDGVLEIRLPRAEPSGREIPVE